MKKMVLIFLCAIIIYSCLPVAYADDASLRISLAQQILEKSSITYSYGSTHYNYYRDDGALAYDNIVDTANGKPAKHSQYGTAPGESVYLSVNMLRAILDLEAQYGSLRITEIAGGDHSTGSKHYDGIAFDVKYIGSGNLSEARGKEAYNYLVGLGYSLKPASSKHPNTVLEYNKDGSFSHYHIAVTGYNGSVTSATLDINGYLDGSDSGNIDGYGTFDLYIKQPGASDRQQVAFDDKDFCRDLPQGTEYWIEDIQGLNIHTFHGLKQGSAGAFSDYNGKVIHGTLGSSRENVSLNFRTNDNVNGALNFGSDNFYAYISSKDGKYQLYNNGSGNVATEGASTAASHVWYFERMNDSNQYKITSAVDGWAFDVTEANKAPGTNLEVIPFRDNNLCQLWVCHEEGGYVEIGSPWTPCVVDRGDPNAYLNLESQSDQNFCWFKIENTDAPTTPLYHIDVNAAVYDTVYWTFNDVATMDVIINGNQAESNVGDFGGDYPAGTVFEFRNISAKQGYYYDGPDPYTVTLNENGANIFLPFVRTGVFDVNFQVDGQNVINLYDMNLGQVEVYIDGKLWQIEGSNTYGDFWRNDVPIGKRYEVRPIITNDAYRCVGTAQGDLTGTTDENTIICLDIRSIYVLDVNGTLDGVIKYSDFGLFDVYIDGKLQSQGTSDFYSRYPSGTHYEITNIRPLDGYIYTGPSSHSGTIGTENVGITLSFITPMYNLDLNGILDGTLYGSLRDYGVADVYINGELKAQGVNDYNEKWPAGTTYEITNIRPLAGHIYTGLSSYTGTVGNKYTSIGLPFSTIYTVTYHVNGGTGAPTTQTKVQDETLTLSATMPTRGNSSAGSYTVTLNANGGSVSPSSLTAARTTSYTFKDWNTERNGSGTSYSPRDSYTANAVVDLYAQWNRRTTTEPVTLPTPTRSGYSFQGWATSDSAESGTTGGYTPTGDVTLYAIWKANTYTVTYNANGGVNAPDSQIKTECETLNLTDKIPTRAGYVFLGWSRIASAKNPTYLPSSSFDRDADTTLYAVWTKPDFVLPAALTAIGEEAFAGGAFRFVKLPENAVSIGWHAFAECHNLAYIYIPATVTEIDAEAFGNATNLTVIGASGSTAETFAAAHGFTFLVG